MKSLYRSERGAITVFFIVIFASIFAFVAIFIDFARIFAMQAKTEILAHAASRSVMSSYDQQLLEKYGLFAFGETDGNYILSKVLQDHLEFAKRSDDLPILGARLDSSTVELKQPLGKYSVFEQQIREQMKYKAPIDFTIEIVNKFKPMSQVMKETSNTVDLLSKLQRLYERREAKLDEMLEKQRKGAGYVQALVSVMPSALEVTSEYGDYVYKYYASLEQDESEDDHIKEDYTSDLISFRHSAGKMYDQLGDKRQQAWNQHIALLNEAKMLLIEAKEINELMKTTIEESEARPAQEGYNDVAMIESTGDTQAAGNGEIIAQIRQKSRDLLISDSLFADFEGDIDGQKSRFSRVYSTGGFFYELESSVLSASASESQLSSTLKEFDRELDHYLQTYWHAGSGNVLHENKKLLDEHRSSDEERKQIENEASNQLGEAANLIKQITNLKDKLGKYQGEYDLLESYFQANQQLNSSAETDPFGSGSTSVGKVSKDPYNEGTEAISGMDTFYGGVADFMKSMSDSGFQGEYIINYYEYFDIGTLDELLKESGMQKVDTLSDSFAPNKQEVEYILYGFHNPAGNIAAAYGEIFAMRLAIRTMEGLVKNVTKGNPMLVLAAALLYGVQHALKDMLDLANKGGIYLSDFLKIKLSYRDHIRIFLLMHGRSEQRLSRMLAVIRHNTGISPDERITYLKSEVTLSAPLWFLPGVAKAMGGIGAIKGRVEGSTYYVTKQADFSY